MASSLTKYTYAMEMPCCPCICAGISGGGRLAWPVVRCLVGASRRIQQRSSCAQHHRRCRWPISPHVSFISTIRASNRLEYAVSGIVEISVCAHSCSEVIAEKDGGGIRRTFGDAIWRYLVSIHSQTHIEAFIPLVGLLRRPWLRLWCDVAVEASLKS